MRLTGDEQDFAAFREFFKIIEKHKLIEIEEVSRLYKNRGESKLYRSYLKIDLMFDPFSPPPAGGKQ